MVGLQILFVALVVCGFALWIVGLMAVIRMTQHRASGVSTFYLLTHGIARFAGRKLLTVEGAAHLRTFRIAAATFTLLVVIAMIVAVYAFGLHFETSHA
jgi:hypothetical protein